MIENVRRSVTLAGMLACGAAAYGATFGSVVPVRGTPSDIALDERHGNLYIANFSAGRVEVMNTTTKTLGTPLTVPYPPSAVAMSPDNRYLVVGEYQTFNTPPPVTPPVTPGGFTIFDLDAGQRQDVILGNAVLAVAFGSASQALMVTTGGFLQLDPQSGRTQTLQVSTLGSTSLTVPFGTFPPNIIETSVGVSGDGNTIIVLALAGSGSSASTTSSSSTSNVVATLSYQSGNTTLNLVNYTSTPALGPRAVSVNQDGSGFMVGWVLLDSNGNNRAQFPYALGNFRDGGHAWDFSRNQIYADIPVTGTESPVLHVVDTDNLTVRERIQLPQMMAGRSVFSSDMNTLYSVSDSGVMVLPVGSLAAAPQIAATQEDVLFLSDSCNRSVITQSLTIAALPGAANADFTVSLPSGTAGIQLSQSTGTTPATIQVQVDPTVFQTSLGTSTVMLNIQSSGAINIPFPVRLLINTPNLNQRGRIIDVPGKIVDILADPIRNRIYLLRQDKNQVLVYNSTTFQRLAVLRTGNTPMGMAITTDSNYLMVGNDNSQLVSTFDLNTLQQAAPIFTPGVYTHVLAAGNGATWATVRSVSPGTQGLFSVDFTNRVANFPPTLGIYQNVVPADSALAASPSTNYVLLAESNGIVAMWDATAGLWGNAREDETSLSGAYGMLSDNLSLVGKNLFDLSLFPVATLESTTGAASGTGVAGGYGLRTTVSLNSGLGTIERIDMNSFQTFGGTSTVEAPVLPTALMSAPIGQIGQTILPFLRTVAVPPDQSSIVLLTQSGMTVLLSNFDAPTLIPSVSSVVNSADGTTAIAQGGLIQIAGTGLAPGSATAGTVPLPFSLGDVCATVSSITIPLFYVTPSTIMAQVPFTVLGNSPLVVRTPGGISSPFSVNVQSSAPAIFLNGTAGSQTGLATVVRDDDNQLVDFTNPIHPNVMISIYLTGLGQTTPQPALGSAGPSNPVANANTPPTVLIGGTPLNVIYAGLVPGEVGVYQIDAQVPPRIQSAEQTPLVVSQGAALTTLSVRVVNP
jgi:uncharacterized protein (TIGR03437 family)